MQYLQWRFITFFCPVAMHSNYPPKQKEYPHNLPIILSSIGSSFIWPTLY